jgi:hypothetical protein
MATPKLSASSAWGILDDNMGSDHFPQFITINSKFPTKTIQMNKLNLIMKRQTGQEVNPILLKFLQVLN